MCRPPSPEAVLQYHFVLSHSCSSTFHSAFDLDACKTVGPSRVPASRVHELRNPMQRGYLLWYLVWNPERRHASEVTACCSFNLTLLLPCDSDNRNKDFHVIAYLPAVDTKISLQDVLVAMRCEHSGSHILRDPKAMSPNGLAHRSLPSLSIKCLAAPTQN